jgi:glutamate--cysteine ligase
VHGQARGEGDEADQVLVADLAALRDVVAASIGAAGPPPPGPGLVGLEVEQLLHRVDPAGRPVGRLDVPALTALLDELPWVRAEAGPADALPAWRLPDGSRLLPEPGGQLEYAGVPHPTADGAVAAARAALRELATAAAARGVALLSAGLDPFTADGAVPQGLTCPRYPAMHAALARRGPHGHTMMTSSASIQVNLDLGADPAARYAVALSAAPLAVAAFACSPVPGAASGRSVVWQWLDPTRTGIPAAFVAGEDDPVEVVARAAWAADVLVVRRGGGAVPGEPGLSFGRWAVEGHPELGRPDRADAAYHLSTLFPEVRARAGVLEVRAVDALPERWRAVPVVLLAGLLYDDRTCQRVRELLEGHRRRLPELLHRAAHLAVADPELCALAVEVWTAAAEGARRLPDGFADPADVRRAESFLDRFTLRGRTPADELRERLADGPAAAADWAREPLATVHLC